MDLPSRGLIDRLLLRFRPPSYFAGANSSGFRTIRDLTLFARPPTGVACVDVHHRHLLVAPLTQSLDIVAGDHLHTVAVGEALLVLPFVPHQYRVPTEPRPRVLFIGFEAGVGDLDAGGVDYAPLAVGARPIGAQGWELIDTIDKAIDCRPTMTPCLMLQLLELLSMHGSAGHRPTPVEQRAWLRTCSAAKHAVHAPFATVPAIAQACATSESALRNDVEAVTGQSLGAFIRRLRIHAVMPLVYRRDYTQAAAGAGYRSVEAFSKAFKAEMGEAPSVLAREAERRGATFAHRE